MPVPEQVELPFPFKGVSGDSAYIRTPEGTSPDALNVVGFDAVGSRLRGGQRPGLSKFWTTQLGGGERVQALVQGTTATQPNPFGPAVTEEFTQDDGVLDNTNWARFAGSSVSSVPTSSSYPLVSSNQAVCAAVAGGSVALHRTALAESDDYELSCDVNFAAATGNNTRMGFVLRLPDLTSPITIGVANSATVMSQKALGLVWLNLMGISGRPPTSSGPDAATWWDTTRALRLVVEGDDFTLYADDIELITTTSATGAGNEYVGFVLGNPAGSTVPEIGTLDSWSLGNTYVPGYNGEHVVAVSNGGVYQAETGSEPSLVIDGGDVFESTVRQVAATLSHGSPNDTGDLPGHQMVYFADGVVYDRLDLNDKTMIAWAAASGTLPADDDGNVATIATTYRNRVVLSGVIGEPQNWYMSAVNDPTDYAYFPTTTSATMAVAGNSSDAGLVGDIVTCLAPYSDDIMLMGGDHTLWVMRGDPAARGIIDNISYQTGIVGPQAFAWDEKGIIHFFGAGTHWRMAASAAAPEPVSRGRMDREWSALDLSANDVILVWDVLRHGLHIHVTPHTTGTAKHWFWDERTDAYWPIEYPNTMNPTATLAYDAALSDDTATLLGGADGYVRQVDTTSKNDDGTLIDSYVFFRPLHLGGVVTNTKLLQTIAVMDESSDTATLSVYSGETAQAALDLGKLHFARTVSAGRNKLLNKAMGNTLLIRLGDGTVSQAWACEQVDVTLAMGGKTRTGSL